MADIVIRGVEVSESLDIIRNGNKVGYSTNNGMTWKDATDFIVLPEGHGRCIDADALIRDKSGEATLWCGYEYQDHPIVFEEDILIAPTIVPAEGGERR
jgi:hypothetical protein